MDKLIFEKDNDTELDFYSDSEDEDLDSDELENHDDSDEKTQLD